MKSLFRKISEWPPPARWLMLFIAGMLFLSFLFAPKAQPVNYMQAHFEVSADDRLFFQNMRSYYYRMDARSKKPMIIYRSKHRQASIDSLSLQFAIVWHPHIDQAFAVAEPGVAFKQYPKLSVLYNEFPADTLYHMDRERHYEIAAKVYSSLLKDQAIYLASDKDTLRTLYEDKMAKRSVLSTLEDYFKLIDKN